MLADLRERFNRDWTPAKYADLCQRLAARAGGPIPFPVSETPCFFPAALLDEMAAIGATLVADVLGNRLARAAVDALVPARYQGPGQESTPTFVQVDFGIVRNSDGRFEPRLVELQAFPSLYGFQHALVEAHREAFGLSDDLVAHLGGLDAGSYQRQLARALVGAHDPADVVLMEIAPAHQKTRPDFAITKSLWGIDTVDPQEVIVRGRQLWRRTTDGERPIRRVYNRIIPDELERMNHPLPFDYRDDLDVEWLGHPAWYFRLSKSAIPWLSHPAVPRTWRLDTVETLPAERHDLVLKPLFSFAGGGIVFAPTDAQLAAIPPEERHLYLLQERVAFAPVISTPQGATQAEVRIMYVQTDELRPVLPLIRMGRGKMMGVAHNKGLSWVGASAAFAPR